MLENTQEFFEELQITINVDLQKLVTHYMEKGADPFTSFNYIHAISEQYITNLKETYGKMAENREEFEKGLNKDIIELADSIENEG